jgi:hypothetical protein
MKKWMANNWLYVTGALLGAAGGYAYYHFVGCSSGTCAITSKPVNSTLYFAVFGAVLFGMFKKEKKTAEN